jgi:hypothetical protein
LISWSPGPSGGERAGISLTCVTAAAFVVIGPVAVHGHYSPGCTFAPTSGDFTKSLGDDFGSLTRERPSHKIQRTRSIMRITSCPHLCVVEIKLRRF